MLRALLVIGKYPATVVAAAYVLSRYGGWTIPAWAVCVAAIVTVPLVIGLAITIRCWLVYRAAERQGATLAPKWEGKWIGNLDVLKDLLHSFRTGYPGEQVHIDSRMRIIQSVRALYTGDTLREKFMELGPTYRLNVLWDFGVLTCDPAIIKVRAISSHPHH